MENSILKPTLSTRNKKPNDNLETKKGNPKAN